MTDSKSERCEPVFVINNQLPAFEQKNFTTAEICAAAEKVCGFNSIEGAQRIGSLWRIYPRAREGRQKLLLHGFVLRGVSVTVKSRNPFIVKTDDGNNGAGDKENDQPATTRLVISNIPLSYSDSEILERVKKMGVLVFSKLISECDRDEEGKLTHWKTGRRFVYIAVPKTPLPKTIELGPFRASLYHKEQKTLEKQQEAVCRRCLEKGHMAATCLAPMKCRKCLQEGHKAGEAACSLTPIGAKDAPMNQQSAEQESNSTAQNVTSEAKKSSSSHEGNNGVNTTNPEKSGKGKSENVKERGRKRQKSPDPSQRTLTAIRREESGSLKRKSRDASAEQSGKQRCLHPAEKDWSDSQVETEAEDIEDTETGWG